MRRVSDARGSPARDRTPLRTRLNPSIDDQQESAAQPKRKDIMTSAVARILTCFATLIAFAAISAPPRLPSRGIVGRPIIRCMQVTGPTHSTANQPPPNLPHIDHPSSGSTRGRRHPARPASTGRRPGSARLRRPPRCAVVLFGLRARHPPEARSPTWRSSPLADHAFEHDGGPPERAALRRHARAARRSCAATTRGGGLGLGRRPRRRRLLGLASSWLRPVLAGDVERRGERGQQVGRRRGLARARAPSSSCPGASARRSRAGARGRCPGSARARSRDV